MRIKLGALFACLAMAFVAPACAVQPASSPEAATESAQADELGVTTDGVQVPVCNGRAPGLPIPTANESQYETCNITCTHNGGGTIPCQRGCCTQATGCAQCYFQ
jgi:hypothetical protein